MCWRKQSWQQDTEGSDCMCSYTAALLFLSLYAYCKKNGSQRGILELKSLGLESILHGLAEGMSIFLFADLKNTKELKERVLPCSQGWLLIF